jgi:hypothetical protein
VSNGILNPMKCVTLNLVRNWVSVRANSPGNRRHARGHGGGLSQIFA